MYTCNSFLKFTEISVNFVFPFVISVTMVIKVQEVREHALHSHGSIKVIHHLSAQKEKHFRNLKGKLHLYLIC